MLSRKNYQEKTKRVSNKQNRYSIRKLSIGVASTLIGISFFGFNAHTVHADVAADAKATARVADQSSVASNDNKDDSSSTNEAKSSIQSNEVAQSGADQKQADSASSQSTNNTDTSTLEKTPAGDASSQSNASQSATVQAKNGKGSETQVNKNENTPVINTNPEQKDAVKPTDTSKAPTPTNKPDDSDTWVIGENNSKTYDGKETNKIDTSKLVLKDNNGKQLNTSSINNDSFQWVDKDGNPISDKIPKDVGIYYIKLTDSALKKLKEENPNVEVSNFTFSYDVKQGTATATLKGYDFESEIDVSKAYNTKSQENKSQENKLLTPDEMIKQGNKIYVDLNIPGLDGEKYKLSDGEYSWLDDDNKPISAPQKNGVYHIILNDKGQTHIRDYIKTLVGKGTELQNGTETEVSDVNVRFDNKLATFYISKKAPTKPTNLPDGTVWTPAGWTRSNPNYAAKESTVKLYESGKELPSKSDKSISKFTKFGTDITAVVDKDDIQVGNKILLATITATNDYAKTADDQLPLTVSSLLDGTPAHDATTGKIIGKYSVTKQDNGEIDYWLIVTDTDSYSEDVKVTANDSQTGYINANQDFSKLAKLSKGSQQLGPNSVISQQITTASNTYTQTYTLPSAIDNGPTRDNDANNVPKDPGKLWINKSKPTMSGNYLNPALDIKFSDISAISSGTYAKEIVPNSYTKVYSITGENLDFSNLTTWERLNISPVDGQIKREASNSVPDGNGNNTLLDKNKKAAIKLSDNLTVQDLIAQTPDGQSAYSIQQDGSVTIVVKVNPNDTKLTKTEIDNYVKSSQYYNLQNKDDHTLQDTENFYERLGYQSLVNDVMIGFSLKNSDENRSWVNFTDISPDKKQHPQSVFQSYAHGKNTIQGKYIRTMTIDYVDVDGDTNIPSVPSTILTKKSDTPNEYSIAKLLPAGYELVGIEAKNSYSRFQINNDNSSFTYTFGLNDVPNKNTGVTIKVRRVTNPVTYSVIDDDSKGSYVGTNIQLSDVTMLDTNLEGIFSNKGSSNEETANQDFQDVVNYWEKSRGYELSKTNPFLNQDGSVNWTKAKNNNYHFDIHVKHAHSIVKNAESKTITRNITVQGIPGINSVQQTITYTRDKNTDLTKGTYTYSNWTTSDNWTKFTPSDVPEGFYIGSIVTDGVEKSYKRGEISVIPGFDAPKSVIDKEIQNIKDTNVLVKYVNDPFNIILEYVDDDKGGKTIPNETVSVPGQALSNYNNWVVPEKLKSQYDLSDRQKQTSVYIGDAAAKTITVHLVHKHEYVNVSKSITRTINYVYSDGRKAKDSFKDSITFTGKQEIDKVTGDVVSNSWDDAPKNFNAVPTQAIEGYTPDQSKVSNNNIGFNSDPLIITVTYKANAQYLKVIYRDLTNNNVLSQVAKDGVSDEDSHYSTQKAIADYLSQGYVLSSDTTQGQNLVFDHIDGQDQVYYVDFTHGNHEYNPENPGAKDKVNKSDYSAVYNTVINYVDNNGMKLADATNVQNEYERSLTIDSVTGDIVKRGEWKLNKGYDAITNPVISGFITNNVSIKPADKQENQTINVVYTALGKIHLVDNKGNEIASDITFTNSSSDPTKAVITDVPSVKGYEQVAYTVDPTAKPTEDQTVIFNAPGTITVNYIDSVTGKNVHSDVVTGFATHTSDYSTEKELQDLVDKGYVVTSDNYAVNTKFTEGQQTFEVRLNHGTTSVDHTKPVAQGTVIDGTKQTMPAGVTENDLNQTITRTITIHNPDKTTTTTTQIAHIYRDATVDNVTGDITYTNWSTDDTNWVEKDIPVHAGYTAHQSDGQSGIPTVTVSDGKKDVNIDVTYTANDQTGKIVYQDVDNNNAEVGHTDLTGKTDADVAISPVAPAGFDIVPGQNIPTSEKATADGIPTVTVKVKHHMITVTPGDEPQPGDKKSGNPDKKPGDGTAITDITYNDLRKAMTRTINVTDPHTGSKTTTKVTLNYERSATIDDVTGAVTYGDWTVADGSKAGFDAFTIPVVAGYTSEIKSGSADDLKVLNPSQDQINNWKDQVVDIDYTANKQSMNITYVDAQNKPVNGGTFTVNGNTDQTVDTNAKIPAGWVLAKGQKDAPKTITFKGERTADITITIEHGMTNVPHNNPVKPGDKTPTGKDIVGAHENDLNQTITRTINITTPDGKTNTEKQTATIHRDATYDDVTGEVTYTDWSTGNWTDFKPAEIPGYTVSQADIPAVAVKDGQKDETVNITYTANDQSIKIIYKDGQNNVIKTDALNGKTDQTVNVSYSAPEHWIIETNQNNPVQYTFKAEKNKDIVVLVGHKLDDKENDVREVKRTVNVVTPDGKTETTTQSVKFTRTHQYDEVAKKDIYGNWDKSSQDLTAVDVPIISGYTAENADVAKAKTVTPDTPSETANITYTANDQTNTVKVMDDDSKVQVGELVTITGKTGTSSDWQVSIPDNYELVSGNKTSGTYTFTADNKQIEIHVQHKHEQVTENKTITRTIIDHVPGENPVTTEQAVTFTHTGDHDLVNNTTNWQEWTSNNTNWSSYTAKGAKGYTPDKTSVAEEIVDVNTENQVITINYKENLASVNFDGNASSDYGQPLNISDLQDKLSINNGDFKLSENDLDWYQDRVKLDKAPENAGNYTVRLKGDVLKTLHEKNDNYRFNFDKNSVNYIINKVDLTAKLTGNSTQQKSANYDLSGYEIQFGSESHKLSDLNLDQNDLIFTRDVNEPSHYSISLTKSAQDKLQTLYANYNVKFANDATIDLKNGHVVSYVDDDNNIVFEDDVTGNDQDEQDYDFNGKLPLGWMLDEDFVVPGKIKMDGTTTEVRIKHATTHVTHDDPKKTDDVLPHNADAHYPAGVDHDDLNKSVTRKIVVNMPDGKQQVIEQTAKFTRDAEVDEVNGNVSYTEWTLDTNGLIEYSAPIVDGYHANIEKVAGETPTVDSQYDDIQINYAADPAPHDDNNGNTDDNHGKMPVVPGDDNHSSVDNNNGNNNNGDTKTDVDNTDTHKENAFVPQAKQDDPASESRQTAPISHDNNGSAHKGEKDTAVKKTNAMAFAAPAAKGFLKTKTKQKQGKPSPKKPASAVAPMHALKKEAAIKPLAAEKANVQNTKQNVPAKNEKAQAPQTKQQSENTLPQTGAKQNNSWLGILLSALGLSALFVNRKKKKD